MIGHHRRPTHSPCTTLFGTRPDPLTVVSVPAEPGRAGSPPHRHGGVVMYVGVVHTVRDATAWAEMMRSLGPDSFPAGRSEEHTSELQSRQYLVCRLLLEKQN